jgi:hypothetical protein
MAMDWYQQWLADKKQRDQQAVQDPKTNKVNFHQASLANNIQYTLPTFSGTSGNKGVNSQWEKDMLGPLSIKQYGRSYEDRFNNLTKSMGMNTYQAQDFRKYLDSQEAAKQTYLLKKDGTPDNRHNVSMGQGIQTKASQIDGILNNMTNPNTPTNQLNAFIQQAGIKDMKPPTPQELAQQDQQAAAQKHLTQLGQDPMNIGNTPNNQNMWGTLKDNAARALDLLHRPENALFTGVKDAAQGGNFLQGLKDGITNQDQTSGANMLASLGFDPSKGGVPQKIAQFVARGLVQEDPTHGLSTPVVNDKIGTNLGKQVIGSGVELGADPLNLVGAGLGTKGLSILSKLKAGKTIAQVANEEKVSEEIVKSLADKYSPKVPPKIQTQSSGDIIDTSVPKLNAPTQEAPLQLNSPQGLPEPLINRNVEGLGKNVQVKGTPQLEAPKTGRPIQSQAELDTLNNDMLNVSQQRQALEDQHVQEQLAPFHEARQQQAAAQQTWETTVKNAKETAAKIKGSFGKISVPKGASEDYPVPPQFKASAKDKTSDDIYKFAEQEGFTSPEEAVHFLQQLDQDSKLKLKDLAPNDGMKLNDQHFKALEDAARKSFADTPHGKAIDSLLNNLMDIHKAHTDSTPKGDPLLFKKEKQFKVTENPVSYTRKMDPNELKKTKFEGSFSTKQVDSPFGDTLKIKTQPKESSPFKRQVEQQGMKQTIKKEVIRKDIIEKDGRKVKADKVKADNVINDLTDKPKVDTEALKQKRADLVKEYDRVWKEEAPGHKKVMKNLDKKINSIDEQLKNVKPETSSNLRPMGIKAGQAHVNDISWVEDPKKLAQKIQDGDVSLGKTIQEGARQVTSDLQPIKNVMKDIAEKDAGATLKMVGKKGKDVAFADNLYKGLRSVRRAISSGLKASKEDYGKILGSLKKNKISQRDFDEYASAVHFRDILVNNKEKIQRKGDISLRLEEIEHTIQHTNIKKEVAALKKEEGKLLKEKKNLEPYTLPKEATPEKIQQVLDRWKDTPTMENARLEFMKAQRKDLQMRVDSGLLSQGEMDKYISAHPNYIYMGRLKEGDNLLGGGGNISKVSKGDIKRKLGSEDNLKLSPLQSAIQNRLITYHNVARNDAMKTIEKLAQSNGGDQYFKAVNTHAISDSDKKFLVKFYKDGKEQYYQVPPVLKQAFESLDEKSAQNFVAKAIRSMNTVIRKGGTHYNTDFILSSPFKETNALITSRTGMHPGHLVLGYMDSFLGKGIEKIGFKSYKHAYEALGGDKTGYVSRDPESLKQFVKAMEKGSLGKNVQILNPIHWIHELGGAIEHGPKLAEFRSAKGKGYSNMDAMHEAQDVIDYADLGSMTRSLNKYVPFLGPMVKGTSRYFQAAIENPGAWAAKNLMYITAPTIAIYSMRFAPWTTDEQRSEINNMSGFKKNMFWAIPAPDGKTIWTIPKMHIGAQIFANPVERILDNVTGQNPKTWQRMLKDSGSDLASTLVPPYSVAGVQLIMDSMANYNRLMDMPIESTSEPQMKLSDKTKTL